MDPLQIQTANSSSESLAFFPPRPRRHLRSETYRTMFLIFSHCYADSFAAHTAANGSNGFCERAEEQGLQTLELVNGDSSEVTISVPEKAMELARSCDDNGSQDKGFRELVAIHQIEELMGSEEIVDFSDKKDATMESDPEQMILDELENLMKGDDDALFGINLNPFRESCSDEVELSIGETTRNSASVVKPDIKESETNDSELEHKVVPADPITEDVDMEDGEITGGYIMDEISVNTWLPKTESQDTGVTVRPLQGLISDGSQFCPEAPSSLVDRLDNTDDGNETVYQSESILYEEAMGYRASMLGSQRIEKKNNEGNGDLVFYGDIFEEDVSRRNKTSKEKGDEVHLKRKRGPISKEKRVRKKRKERKKQAEMNRKLGVTRVKQLPLVKPKPKPVNHCRHYIKGRCQQGEKCSFSHDVVPETKSTACTHFARNSCMKGDDCPFDHQLSKYPCHNFASTGFCYRGGDCMFSHKILPKEDPSNTLTSSEPDTKSRPLMSNATPPKQQNNGTAVKHSDQSAKGSSRFPVAVDKCESKAGKPGTAQKSNVTPKGISFLSFQKDQRDNNGAKQPPLEGLNMPAQASTPPSSDSMSRGNQPVIAPKGINFLAFGSGRHEFWIGDTASSSTIGENVDSMAKIIQPLATLKEINSSSSKSASTDEYSFQGKSKLNAGTISPFFTVSPLDNSASKMHKELPRIAQRALSSTLAFAEECRTKSKQQIAKAPLNSEDGSSKLSEFWTNISKE